MSEPYSPNELARPRRFKEFLRREGPYLALLTLTVLGIVMTGIAKHPINLYWEIMAPLIGLACVVTAWPQTKDRADQWRLIWRQVLHWIAFLVAMNVALLPDVQRFLNPTGVGLMILLQLALGTFIAGVHISSWRICFIAVVMAVGVPMSAWIERSAFAILLVVALVGVALAFRGNRDRKADA